MNTNTHIDEKQKFYDLLSKFKTAMLVTNVTEDKVHARPMAFADVNRACEMWFFSYKNSPKIYEIKSNSRVHVICQDDRNTYVSASGIATLMEDRRKIDELWQESYKTWFPEGKDDPNLILIKVEADEGEYWDQSGINKVKYLFETTRAYISGDTPNIEEGEQHGKVAFN